MQTNRDLYRFIATLIEKRKDSGVSLESYLVAFQELVRRRGPTPTLKIGEFAKLLEAAFAQQAASAQPPLDGPQDFRDCDQVLTNQIRDLREMKADGTLDDDQRYFGVDAPSGARWYNFDPCTYIECGATGAFGGWEEGDDTGRNYVPGQVAVMDESGNVTSADPRELESPTTTMPELSWSDLEDFLQCGQMYE